MIKKLFLSISILASVHQLFSQTVDQPNFGLKSHPTLDIESVLLTNSATTLFMVIENQSLDGTFCADKNIFIALPNGKHLKIKSAEGIPRCPETYVFKTYGEKMLFNLTFPAIPEGTQWFDLIEDCNDACFSFNSVILDPVLNQKIDHAYSLMESKDLENASLKFEDLLAEFSDKKCSYTGAIYWNLIEIARQSGDDAKSKEWMEKLVKSDIPLKEKFIENLKSN
jgi:hypothetical protein